MKLTPVQKYFIVLFLFSSGFSTLAQKVYWEQTSGPITGTVTLIQSGTEKNIFCLANNRLYNSNNNGRTWKTTNLPNRDIATFVIREDESIFAAGIIYCTMNCFQSGIFFSKDKGESWQTIHIGSPDNTVRLFNTGADGRIFSYTSDGLYYIDSGADTWYKINIDSSRVWLRTLTCRDNGIVAGVTNNSTYLSLNNGETWVNYSYLFPSELYINTLAIYNDSILFGLDYSSLYRSTDCGQTWKELKLPIKPNDISNIQITEEGQILVGTDVGAFSSWDIGNTWDRIFQYNIKVYSFTLTLENELLVGTSDAVYRREIDKGWIRSSKGIIENKVSELTCLRNGKLLAGTFYDGLFITSDGGQNWEELNFPVTTTFESIVEIPGGEAAFGIIGYPGLYLSDDALTKWKPVNLKNIGSLTSGIGNTLFAGAVGRLTHGIYRSVDHGETWTMVGLESDEVNELNINEFGILYAGTLGNGVYHSVDNGETWQQVGLQGENIRALTTGRGKLIFAGTITGYIFRSEDGGDNWENVYYAKKIVSDIVILPNGLIFAGTGSGVYISEDNGFTWKDYSTGLPEDAYKISLAYDAQGYLYAGTWGDGVFRSITPIISSVKDKQGNLPMGFTLLQNYPNPFNPATIINYSIPKKSLVTIKVYDFLGREISTLVNEEKPFGKYSIEFNANNLSSGIYFYQIKTDNFFQTKKMILLR